MANTIYEALSALMDNEADDLELRRLLKEMEAVDQAGQGTQPGVSPAELKAKWHRYHVISACLKQEIHTSPSRNLLADIQAELANEPAPIAETFRAGGQENAAKVRKNILQMLGQGAVAASMALAVLFTADMLMVAESDSAAGSASVIAGNDSDDSGFNTLRGLTGDLNPTTQTRVAIQSNLDEAEFNRLERVVSEELESTLERPEMPATYVPQERR